MAVSTEAEIKKHEKLVTTLWLVAWLTMNMSTSILNKAAYQFAKFNYPLCLSALHLWVQSIFTWFYVRMGRQIQRKSLTWREHALLVMFAHFFALNIVTGNASLRYVTVSFSRVTRTTVPIVTIFLSWLILNKSYALKVKLSLLPILAGAVVATYGEVGLTSWGLILAMLAVWFAALKAVLSNKYLTGSFQLHPLDLLDRTAPVACFILFPFIIWTGEGMEMVTNWKEHATPGNIVLVMSTAAAALGLNYTSFKLNQVTSALALTVASNAKESLTIVISVFIFRNRVTFTGLMGMILVLVSSLVYSYVSTTAKIKEQAKTKEPKEQMQDSQSVAVLQDKSQLGASKDQV